MIEACTEPDFRMACVGLARRRLSYASSATRNLPALAMASMPRSGREPCAARPCTITSNQAKPLCATVSSRWLGSVTIAASARKCRATSSVPDEAYSSSATQATRMSPRRPLGLGARCRHHHRRDAALHVERAAAVELAVAVDSGIERIAVVAGERHRVVMAVEHQRAAAARTLGDADDRRPARTLLEAMHLEAALGEPGAAEIGDCRLAGAARHQVGIDGIDRHEALQEFDRIVAHFWPMTSSGVRPTIRA